MFKGLSEAPVQSVGVRRGAPDARHAPRALQWMTLAWTPRRWRKPAQLAVGLGRIGEA